MTSSRQKILFLTDSDYGQANVVLSIAYALVQSPPNVEVHIASQTRLKAADCVRYHQVVGLSHFDALNRPGNAPMDTWVTKPTIGNMLRIIFNIPAFSLPWSPEEFVEIYRDIEHLANEIRPDVIVAEAFFAPAVTFCHQAQTRWIALAPNTIKEFALPVQPKMAMFWKYPMICSSFPYPVPWHLMPLNVLYNALTAVRILTSWKWGRYHRTSTLVARELGPDVEVLTMNQLGLLTAPPEGLRILVAISTDIDFPFEVVPEYITPCGPITRAAPQLASEDPELATWLGRGPTIYMNLGTHHQYDVALAREVALSFRRLLALVAQNNTGQWQGLQVLWKMPRKSSECDDKDPATSDYSGPWTEANKILGPELDKDRVRIVDWITAKPKSILESGHIVMSVNHGGANSFYESICSGIPQVILASWVDCFDFAQRAEILGVGKWANRKSLPFWEHNELSAALETVLLGPESEQIRQKAQELRKRHPEAAGRDMAAKEIIDLLSKAEEES
ncbi:Glycosyltransferase sdnJ [Colletotrichum orbiculare MAFF 240422]|uniref:Glycosyltransferase sdnJ n=1 Tax=Colletotrichum orbiculare (strain 104-T / ATCC 96160 / CBS 514.97 / LARS 414 / MAFF 240422) TaxID=1213857 RepID=A0A484F9J4_COLOR|nr:Glycosyltransferase sdnJ [Colletotrichum orbiculare MAFF 240422]